MILDKLLGTLMLSMASCHPTTFIQEPNRAQEVYDYQILNATPNELLVDYYPEDSTVTVPANESAYIVHETSGTINVYTKTKFYGYCFFAPDSEELVPITWNATSGTWNWYATISDYGPARGIGFYNQTPIPTNKDFYIDWQKFEPTNPTNTMDNLHILPDNSVWDFYKEDGSYYRANAADVVLFRKQVEGSTVLATALGIKYNADLYILVCQNYLYPDITGFDPDYLAQGAEKKINTLSATMFFYGGFTSKVRCHSGYYPFYPDEKGYTNMKFISEFNPGYQGYGSNTQEDTFTALGKGIELMEIAINTAVMIFGFVIFPGITVGSLLMIPILVMLLLWLIRLIKRGG